MLSVSASRTRGDSDPNARGRGGTGDAPGQGPRRLLLVDDERELRQLLAMVLADAGWAVVEAEDGERALEHIAVQSFDLVLLDHRMPGLTGSEVVQRLRADGDPTPVVLMTAARDVGELARGLGLPRFLGKPFEVDELLAILDDVANGSDPA